MTQLLLAILRNCGVAIAISVFFAAAHGPANSSHARESNQRVAAASDAAVDASVRPDDKDRPAPARR
jgi:hypothetical protein